MAKQVTQETFDNVVKENIKEFEMSVEDAVIDAVQQFEAQGVNLSMIIKDSSLYSADGEKLVPPVLDAVNALSLSIDEYDMENCRRFLAVIKHECDKDLITRCFAGKNNAYQIVIKSLNLFMERKNEELFIKTLETLCSLCDGQPDLLGQQEADLFMKIMRNEENSSIINELIIKLVSLNCIKHERNRQIFISNGLIKELVRLMTMNKSRPEIVKKVSFALRVLTQDDDVRVVFGSAHENAKQIVMEMDALKRLLEICSDYASDVSVQSELFATLSKLVVRNEFCKEVMDLGGLNLIMKSFEANLMHKGIVKQVMGLLQALAGNDDLKVTIVKAGGIQLILSAMTQHQGNAYIAGIGCLTLATLLLRQPQHGSIIMVHGGHYVIIQAMKIHAADELVQKQACLAIRNIVARCRDYCRAILELGAEELINRACKIESCVDEAKAALRDLGCKVDLKEPWTGEKGSLPQTAY